jgi:hypothetical protein
MAPYVAGEYFMKSMKPEMDFPEELGNEIAYSEMVESQSWSASRKTYRTPPASRNDTGSGRLKPILYHDPP